MGFGVVIVADDTLSGPAQEDKNADVMLCRFQGKII
jgi:hypothetical protein